jgi:hypothetical protein
MRKRYRHPSSEFGLALPDDWEFAVKRASVAFFQPSEGVGALNVSAMTPQQGAIIDPVAVALDFVPKKLRTEVKLSGIASDSSPESVYTEYETADDAWRLWILCGPTRVVVVSYNCQRQSKGIEDPVVDAIVASIRAS